MRLCAEISVPSGFPGATPAEAHFTRRRSDAWRMHLQRACGAIDALLTGK